MIVCILLSTLTLSAPPAMADPRIECTGDLGLNCKEKSHVHWEKVFAVIGVVVVIGAVIGSRNSNSLIPGASPSANRWRFDGDGGKPKMTYEFSDSLEASFGVRDDLDYDGADFGIKYSF